MINKRQIIKLSLNCFPSALIFHVWHFGNAGVSLCIEAVAGVHFETTQPLILT